MVLSIWQVLDAIAELREASLELVAWELNVTADDARQAFERVIDEGLIARSGVDPVSGEVLYALTAAGRRALHERIIG
jgi:DNA-binding MarR family transcriptional regulator